VTLVKVLSVPRMPRVDETIPEVVLAQLPPAVRARLVEAPVPARHSPTKSTVRAGVKQEAR
jgi:hypothetical protein